MSVASNARGIKRVCRYFHDLAHVRPLSQLHSYASATSQLELPFEYGPEEETARHGCNERGRRLTRPFQNIRIAPNKTTNPVMADPKHTLSNIAMMLSQAAISKLWILDLCDSLAVYLALDFSTGK
jgi:hypothetical protein